MEAQFENLRSKLIVSCQALEDEPLHSSFIMGRMAKAAYEGGAAGIRANTVEDILCRIPGASYIFYVFFGRIRARAACGVCL